MKITAILAAVGVFHVLAEAQSLTTIPQPTPLTDDQTLALKFKPALSWEGCLPSVIVDQKGNTNFGQPGVCENQGEGTQVYGRSGYQGRLQVTLYSWNIMGIWPYVILCVSNTTILGLTISTTDEFGFFQRVPLGAVKDSKTTFMYSKGKLSVGNPDSGSRQDLIMWHQLEEPAKNALNKQFMAPISDLRFNTIVSYASTCA